MRYGEDNELNLKLLITLSRCMAEINKAQGGLITKEGLTMGQFAVLEVLYHKGELCINDIISKILSSSGNVTVVIENLYKAGLISKVKDTKDKRITLVSITDKGKGLIEKIFPRHLENLSKIMGSLGEEEKLQMISLAKKLGKSIEHKEDY